MLLIPNCVLDKHCASLSDKAMDFQYKHMAECEGYLRSCVVESSKIAISKIFCKTCRTQFVIVVPKEKYGQASQGNSQAT